MNMSKTLYKFQETQNKRWGIYFEGRLLATVGNYEVCQSIGKCLDKNLSSTDSLKATLAYQKAINSSLTIK